MMNVVHSPMILYAMPLPSAQPSLAGFMAYNPLPGTRAPENELFVFHCQDLPRPMGTGRDRW